MTTATDTATWPTEETYEAAVDALANAYNHVEKILWDLNSILGPYNDEGKTPAELPTAETVGLMWSFLDDLESEVGQARRNAANLERMLREVDTMRREASSRAR
jgi:hypothetical protein